MVSAAVAGAAGELAAKYPIPKVTTIAGRKVEISPGSIRHCTEVWQRSMLLAALMDENATEVIFADEHPAEAAELLAFATGLDRDWIAELSAFDKVDLGLTWLEVNRDFFAQALRPERRDQQNRVREMFGLGATPSNTSGTTDTPPPMTTRPSRSMRGSKPSPAPNGAAAASG